MARTSSSAKYMKSPSAMIRTGRRPASRASSVPGSVTEPATQRYRLVSRKKSLRRAMTSGRSTSTQWMLPLSRRENRVLRPAPRLITTARGCLRMKISVPASRIFVRTAIPVCVIHAPSNLEKS